MDIRKEVIWLALIAAANILLDAFEALEDDE